MNVSAHLPAWIVLSACLPGLLIFITGENRIRLRRTLNLTGNLLCVGLIAILIHGVYNDQVFETRLPLLPEIDLVLHADALSLLFVSLSGLLWLLTTIYAIAYLEGTEHRSRFFGFFSLCVGATVGIALAGNLITFLIFYELLTLTTYPLVVHKGDRASLRAGRIYLTYTMLGGALLLAGVVWLKAIAGPLAFTATGILADMPHLNPLHLQIIFVLLIAGLGVKAALIPLHGWLPVAMAAPAPVSALLHAVAVVKAGAFGIIRVVYDVYGITFTQALGLTTGLAVLATVTIVYGSLRALFQDDIKKRLAYSTVSQVSYIALGTAIAGPIATIGGMVHLVHQGLMKITLFFCAGNLAETLGIHKVSQLQGVGRRMPLTMAAFTLAALGMIGLPPLAGFVSKWYLGTGALEVDAHWVLVVLAISSLLNAMYFLPLLHAAWFKAPQKAWTPPSSRWETHWMLVLPPVMTAALAVVVGLFASAALSPTSWSKLIAAREYGQVFVQIIPDAQLPVPQLWWAVITPLLLAIGLLWRPVRRVCLRVTPLASLPALAVALTVPAGSNTVPWLLFGSVMALDDSAQVMLLLAAVLWLVASLYGHDYLRDDPHAGRYSAFYLICMTGSFGLILAQDVFGFITFFTVMSLAAYGLVIHTGSDAALAAGRTYMQWVVIGEVLLFAAFVTLMIIGENNTPYAHHFPVWLAALFVVGFGVKTGLLTLHVWLPRAHPVAPVPASALLSGLMVKAGLLGWMRFLPMGEVALPDLGALLILVGLLGAFYGVVVGLLQANPKALLAYSTISQMGILASGVGAGMMAPALWPVLMPALLLYALHHGLAKAALFLSVGHGQLLARAYRFRGLVWLGVLLPALALAGVPLTSGAMSKFALKSAVADMPWLTLLLPLTAVGTTCLMLRFLALMHASANGQHAESRIGATALSAYAALLVIIIAGVAQLPIANGYFSAHLTHSALWTAAWPLLVGGSLYLLLRQHLSRLITSGFAYNYRMRIAIPSLQTWLSQGKNTRLTILNDRAQTTVAAVMQLCHIARASLPLPYVQPGIAFLAILLLVTVALGIQGH